MNTRIPTRDGKPINYEWVDETAVSGNRQVNSAMFECLVRTEVWAAGLIFSDAEDERMRDVVLTRIRALITEVLDGDGS